MAHDEHTLCNLNHFNSRFQKDPMTWLRHHPGRPVARLPVFQTDLGHKNPPTFVHKKSSAATSYNHVEVRYETFQMNTETLHEDFCLSYYHTQTEV